MIMKEIIAQVIVSAQFLIQAQISGLFHFIFASSISPGHGRER